VDDLTDVFKNLLNNCGKTKTVKAFSKAHGGFSTSFSQVFKHFAHTRLDLYNNKFLKDLTQVREENLKHIAV